MDRERKKQVTCLEKGILLVIILLQCVLCMILGFNRKYLFTDEVYTYGLANSENFSFVDPGENPALLDWTSGEYFNEYLQYDSSKPFSFHAAFVNQANDVHPPLYYCLIHGICFFLRDLIYSPIPGILLNLICLPFIDGMLFYIAVFFFPDKRYAALLAVVLWAFSASCISNAIFIRMYWLMTLEMLAVSAYHVYLVKNKIITFEKEKGKPPKKISRFRWAVLYVLLILLVAGGGLTHYYFYFFTATLGLCVCTYLLLCRKYKYFFAYGSALWLGVFLALAVFPETWQHIFGYRGEYATQNIGGLSLGKFHTYFNYINRALLGGSFWILLIVLAAGLLWKHWLKHALRRYSFENGKLTAVFVFTREMPDKKIAFAVSPEQWLMIFTGVAVAGFCYVAIQGSAIENIRYIYPAFPYISVFFVLAVQALLPQNRNGRRILCLLAVLLPILSIKVYGIDWLYSDFDQVTAGSEKLRGTDCIVLCRDDAWVNVLQAIDIYRNMDEVRCVYVSEMDHIAQVIEERATDDPLCVAFYSDENYSPEERESFLDDILTRTPYQQYTMLYDYYTVIYMLS